MEVPILKQGDFLIASIQSALSDDDLLRLQKELADQVGKYRSRGVIVDVTALDVLDSFATRTVRNLSQVLYLRGARTVIVGIQPEVAFAMTELGLTLGGVETAWDLEEGLSLLTQPEDLHIEVQKVEHDSRVHIDIETDDIEAEVHRLEKLGARRVAYVKRWWVMEAPTGQRFCVVRPQRPDFDHRANSWAGEQG